MVQLGTHTQTHRHTHTDTHTHTQTDLRAACTKAFGTVAAEVLQGHVQVGQVRQRAETKRNMLTQRLDGELVLRG